MNAQYMVKYRVWCDHHDVDEPAYWEYVASPEVAEAWVTLHNLQHHGGRATG